jgi:hypothetical protein
MPTAWRAKSEILNCEGRWITPAIAGDETLC